MERYSVNISARAWADMRGILNYISTCLREPSVADRLLDRLEKSAQSLETMPNRYALVPDSYLASAGFRMTSVGSYLIFYMVDQEAKTVDISRVLNARQNWTELLASDLPQ